jgi:hypothetical protein
MTDVNTWNWTRYWIPRDQMREQDADHYWPFYRRESEVTLEEMEDRRLLVLLGEPGSGKSVVLRVESRRLREKMGRSGKVIFLDGRTTIHDSATLWRYWFDSDDWKDWQASQQPVWLFFDGFDESAKLIPNLAGIIETELEQIKVRRAECLTRLYLRFGSRSTGWSESLRTWLAEFVEIRGPNDREAERVEFLYTIAPPTRRDIQQAAHIEQVDGNEFLRQIDERRVEPLAMRPAQLKWLIAIYRQGGALPTEKGELYWKGMRQHSLIDGQQFDGKLTRVIASRIAFVSTYSGSVVLWTGPDRGDLPDGALLLSDTTGGTETVGIDGFLVTADELAVTVQSGLFTQVGEHQIVWAHQTFSEFLAARYLIDLVLPVGQMLGLITNPHDDTRKILPGMTEVAAWIASMSPEVLSYMLEYDPETLVESDVALTEPEERRLLLRSYLRALDEGRAIQDWYLNRGSSQKFRFEGIATELETVLSNRLSSKAARDTAIDIAIACDLDELAPLLSDIALDGDESEVIRRSAAHAVSRLSDPESHRRLLPLISTSPDEDPFEELRGYALSSNWPGSVELSGVLASLSQPRWEGGGSYRHFLTHDFVKGIARDDLMTVLDWWAAQDRWESAWNDWEEIESKLINRALQSLDIVDVFEWVVQRIAGNLENYKGLLGGSFDRPREDLGVFDDSDIRRALWIALSQSRLDAEHLRTVAYSLLEVLRGKLQWLGEDFNWMVEQLWKSTPQSSGEEFWLYFITRSWYWDIERYALVYDLYRDERFKVIFANDFGVVELSSKKAEELRTRYLRQQEGLPKHKYNDVIDDEIRKILEVVESEKPDQWWRIDHRLQFDEHRGSGGAVRSGVTPTLQSWHLCSGDTQSRVLSTALPFLEAFIPHLDAIGTSQEYWDHESAYWALVWLKEMHPGFLDQISDETWLKTGPVILAKRTHSQSEEKAHRQVLFHAIDRRFNPIPWLELMLSRAPDGESYYLASALDSTLSVCQAKILADELGALADLYLNLDVPFEIMLEAFRRFFAHKYPSAFERAVEIADALVADPDRQSDTSRLLNIIMANIGEGSWGDIKALICARDSLFKEVFLGFADWGDRESQFSEVLSEGETVELYELLAHHFPPGEDELKFGVHTVTDRERLGQWRDGLLARLARRGTWEAVEEFRELAKRPASSELVRRQLNLAEDSARLATWHPPSVDELMGMVRGPGKRLITSAEQLQEVVLESLAKLQKDLQAPTPAAESWWNNPHDQTCAAPKREEECSNEILRHLDRDLSGRMVLANREVKSRHRNIKDLLVEVMVPSGTGGGDRISVVCEVKGCWNRDLMTSQKNQLLKQYMQQEGYTHGIYIVAFFDGERWEPQNRNSRHSKNRRHTLESLTIELSKQAEQLSVDGKTIRAVVLDLNFKNGPVVTTA